MCALCTALCGVCAIAPLQRWLWFAAGFPHLVFWYRCSMRASDWLVKKGLRSDFSPMSGEKIGVGCSHRSTYPRGAR